MSQSGTPPPPDPAAPLSDLGGLLAGLDPGELLAWGLEPAEAPPGEARWTPPSLEEVQQLLPAFAIESLLGHGGMGAVYKARQISLDRTVAIKLLSPEMAADEEFIVRFRREARLLGRLQHPGIVSIHDFGQTEAGYLYIVMEYVDGTDLQRAMGQSGLPSDRALELTARICEALQYAHRRGVVHRDIKPANVLLTQEGAPKLADFGLARPFHGESSLVTRANVRMGTPAYMAPEQRAGASDHRGDIYSLGVVLYEMLTGRRPAGFYDPPSRRVQVDVRLDGVVLKALQEEPELRYQKAGDMQTDVEKIRHSPSSPRRRWFQSTWRWMGLAAVAGLLAAAIAWPWAKTPDRKTGPAPSASPSPQPSPPPPSPSPPPPTPASSISPLLLPALHPDQFGGWKKVGHPGLSVEHGELVLTASGDERSGIASQIDNLGEYLVHLELAGSADLEAWVGVRVVEDSGRWQGYTSHLAVREGMVEAGFAGRNFVTDLIEANPHEHEGGMRLARIAPNQFFSMDHDLRRNGSLWTAVDGTMSSGVSRRVPAHGGVGLFLARGTLRVRKIERH